MNSEATYECPICGTFWPVDAITVHVDECLDSANSDGSRFTDLASNLAGITGLVHHQDLEDNSSTHSNGSSVSEPSPVYRKRAKFDLANWCGKSPKKTFTAPADTSPPFSVRHNQHAYGPSHSRRTPLADRDAPAAAAKPLERDLRAIEPKKLINSGCSEVGNGISTRLSNKNLELAPWAEKMRPAHLEEFVGQEHILQSSSVLRTLIETGDIPSMVFWGPPGCGKTSLANVIAKSCFGTDRRFVTLSATNSGVTDVKEVIKAAKNDWTLLKRKTILFIDEIHRFNKLQQDTFLPYVENGTITLIGATTENPSFSLNSALLSRSRVFTMEKLSIENVENILERTVNKLNLCIVNNIANTVYDRDSQIYVEKDALTELAHLSDGDARIAINCLQLAVEAVRARVRGDDPRLKVVTIDHIRENLQRTHLMYDRKGDEHYNCISALHKSMRGSDADASLYWLGRMLEGGEDPLYVARRLIRFASEDIGLADTLALPQAVAAYQACSYIGMPECDVILAQCVVYLARAPKSIEVYKAYSKVKQHIKSFKGPLPGVPLHLRNAPTRLMKDLGYAAGYKYNPHYNEPVHQNYLPENLIGIKFLD